MNRNNASIYLATCKKHNKLILLKYNKNIIFYLKINILILVAILFYEENCLFVFIKEYDIAKITNLKRISYKKCITVNKTFHFKLVKTSSDNFYKERSTQL